MTLQHLLFDADTTFWWPVQIEVKAKGGTLQSLRSHINNPRYADISWDIKLSMANIGFANNTLVLPYYCATLLKRYLGNK